MEKDTVKVNIRNRSG